MDLDKERAGADGHDPGHVAHGGQDSSHYSDHGTTAGAGIKPRRRSGLRTCIAAVVCGVLIFGMASPALAGEKRTTHVNRRMNVQEATAYAQLFKEVALGAGAYCASNATIKKLVKIPGGGLGAKGFQLTYTVFMKWAGGDSACEITTKTGLTAYDLWNLRSKKPHFTYSSQRIVQRLRPDLCQLTLKVNGKTQTVRGPMAPGATC